MTSQIVWVVETGEYEQRGISAIFSDERLAQRHADARDGSVHHEIVWDSPVVFEGSGLTGDYVPVIEPPA